MVCKHNMHNFVFFLLAAIGDVSAKLMIDIWRTPRKWMLGSVNCPTHRYGHASLRCVLVGQTRDISIDP